MISLEQAHEIFSKIEVKSKSKNVTLTDAEGLILAEDISSDVDMPPFNKSAMDGYACKQEDLSKPLKVVEIIPAGQSPTKEIKAGECAKIMTGAEVPQGADCVIMVEYTKELENNSIKFTGNGTKANICYTGEDVKINDNVLTKGSILTPSAIAVAASVGKTTLSVFTPPKIALITTGDELIEPHLQPSGAKIRNSNAYNLMAQIKHTPARVDYKGIVPDEKALLEKAIISALEETDILILTGGVSMGDKDYIPEILAKLGLEVAFNKLAIQPGKPVAFAHGNDKFCFGLSGNPVSSMLQFELLAKPFIYKFMYHNYKLPLVKMKLSTGKKRKKTERLQFFPIQLINGEAKSLEFHGSAHIAGLTQSNGFGIFQIGQQEIAANEEIDVLLLK